ncbi:MAG: response regulator [Myxococcales bacterium]|nr:response regulator [Myxococcales bacterium]
MSAPDLTHLQGLRVLVGEHEVATRLRLIRMLEGNGADAAGVESSLELLSALVEDGPFDAVISDVELPGRSCADVIAMTRGAGLGISFIVLADPADRRTARYLAPDVSLVPTPVDEEILALELERLASAPHACAAAKCVFVACAACGGPHIAELWPPNPSFCPHCIRRVEDANEAGADAFVRDLRC